MVIDLSLYGSRNFSDQHRDMRLDVDNMSYEVGIAHKDFLFFFSVKGE